MGDLYFGTNCLLECFYFNLSPGETEQAYFDISKRCRKIKQSLIMISIFYSFIESTLILVRFSGILVKIYCRKCLLNDCHIIVMTRWM